MSFDRFRHAVLPRSTRTTPTVVAGVIASLCFAVSAEAQASDCHVSNTVDDVAITNTLRWCVAKVNAGAYSGIVFDNSLTYALDTPLSLKADGGIKGNYAEIVPSASFVGGSLVEIDPGLTWKIFDLLFDGAGVVGPRGVAVGVNSRLVFDRVSLGGFDTANDGAGLWLDDADLYMSEGNIQNCRARSGGAIAANGGEINLFGVALGDNTAADSGGAVYLTGAPVFSGEDSDFVANEALQGGAVYSVGASVVLTNVEMAGNHAIDFGGGIVSPLQGASCDAAPRWCSGQAWQQRNGTGRTSEGSGQRSGEQVA